MLKARYLMKADSPDDFICYSTVYNDASAENMIKYHGYRELTLAEVEKLNAMLDDLGRAQDALDDTEWSEDF